MNKFAYKFVTAAATAVIALGSFGPAALGSTTISINGNGSDSSNAVNFGTSTTTAVTQTNTATVNNTVNASASTGDNSASRNTGGATNIDTGNANNTTSVSTTANSNVATVNGCCNGDTSVKVSGNGADSTNTATVGIANTTQVTQTNVANVTNYVDSSANSGDNKASRNTGGDVMISTGNAANGTSVTNKLNSNFATVGGDGSNGGTLDVAISGNGSDSNNTINLGIANQVWATQYNDANIDNNVESDANTGDNKAYKNTGGDASIDTGDAENTVSVDNLANFNGADLSSCDCSLDGEVKVSGNGESSDNTITAELGSISGAEQTNNFNCGGHDIWGWNWLEGSNGDCAGVNADATTGGNKLKSNTGESDDPSVVTGDASSDVEVTNTANQNVLGDVQIPDTSGWDFSSGNFEGFVVWLLAHIG